MDIGSVSTAMSMTEVRDAISFAVLDNSLETIEDLGNGMIKMLEASVTPHLGQNIDYSV